MPRSTRRAGARPKPSPVAVSDAAVRAPAQTRTPTAGIAPPAIQAGAQAPCACGGGCPRCRAAAAAGPGPLGDPADRHERQADAMAAAALAGHYGGRSAPRSAASARQDRATQGLGGGRPLDTATLQFMESRFGTSFGSVRIHHDDAAAHSAARHEARAYTQGADVVFGAGQYAPQTASGRQLIAHELAHVIQQRRGAASGIQRAPDFGPMYGNAKPHVLADYDSYYESLPDTQASSDYHGSQHPLDLDDPITTDELLAVYTGVKKDIAADPAKRPVFELYVQRLNAAFKTFLINTVEAQASFIANGYHESDQFRYFTETEKSSSTPPPPAFQQDPKAVSLNRSYLDCAARVSAAKKAGQKPSAADHAQCEKAGPIAGYETGGTINATGNWDESFIGRGPIQVTHRHYYVQVIAVMDKRATELEEQDPYSSEAADLRTAIREIAADPRQAANPKYTFLFSAAFMKMPDDAKHVTGDDKASWGNIGGVTSWMGQQDAGAKERKKNAYYAAVGVLLKKWEQQKAKRKAAEAEKKKNTTPG